MNIIEWIVWGIGILILIIHIPLYLHRDPLIARLFRIFAALIIVGLLATVFTEHSKLHLLWWIPVAFILHKVIFYTDLQWKFNRLLEGQSKGEAMGSTGRKESEAHDNSGVAPAESRRILTINDNPSHNEDWKQLFEEGSRPDTDFEIDAASQGQEGLQKIRRAFQEGRPYVAAFVDVRMPPGWDGVKTIEQIWAEYPDLPAVIYAPYSDYSASEIIERLGRSDKLLIFKYPPDDEAIRRFAVAITKEWECKQATQFKQVLMQAAKLPWARILDQEEIGGRLA
jgi:CheY-like chemotaxis protein